MLAAMLALIGVGVGAAVVGWLAGAYMGARTFAESSGGYAWRRRAS